jgi:hypothetical protein
MNWHQRIDRSAVRGGFTELDVELARDWPTCACGEQDPRIPRDKKGQPRDLDLAIYGGNFLHAVRGNDVARARAVLAQIEKRAGELLKGQS